MTVVFVVEKGCRHEGGEAMGVASTKEGAQRIVERLIRQHDLDEAERVRYWKEEGGHVHDVQVFQQDGDSRWTTQFDVITIREFEVEDEVSEADQKILDEVKASVFLRR